MKINERHKGDEPVSDDLVKLRMEGLRVYPTTTTRNIRCASEGCKQRAEYTVEANGIASQHCAACAAIFEKYGNS
jgi:hypothetical protein